MQTLSRAGAALTFALLATGACHEPTQIELWLSTDLPCDGVHGTSVSVGRRGELEDAFPSASLTVCETGADGHQHLGLIVLVPRDGSEDALALKVVAAVTATSPDECKPGKGSARGYQGCIVARRELRYQSGHTLRVPVPMLRQCEGVECTTDSTCFDATTCMPAGVTCSEEACAIDDVPALHFPNPLGPGPAVGSTAGAAGSDGADGQSGAGSGGQTGDGNGGQVGVGGGGQAGVGSGGQMGGQAGTGGKAGAGSGASAGSEQGGTAGVGGHGGGPSEKPVIIQAAGAWRHSCALTMSGEVYCWGYNANGQLGDGTRAARFVPAPVLQSPGGLPLTDVKALSLGDSHSCALLASGEARCWGFNDRGQIGNGTADDQLIPMPVLQSVGGPPLTDVKALSLGGSHSCALLAIGEIRCWGSNSSGQLGDGTMTERLTPVSIVQSLGGPPLIGVQAIALGSGHSFAVLASGEARGWGANSYGQLGDGTTGPHLNPVALVLSPSAVSPLLARP